MRILFISNLYPPHDMGGYEQWCAEVASQLSMRGHKIEILTSNYGITSGLQDITCGISRVLYLQSNIAFYRPLDFFLKHAFQERSNIQILRQKIDRFHPDIIMVWGMWNLSQNLPYWAEQWMPHRVAYFISNYWPMDIDAHTAYWCLPANHLLMENVKRPLRKIALGRLQSDKYSPKLRLENAVCCSQYVRNTLMDAGKLPASARVLLGGIDPEPFLRNSKLKATGQYNQRDELNLLYFGRLIHDKGVHTAIEALGLLKQKGFANKIRLTILGSGHPVYEAELKKLVKSLDVEDSVVFVQQVPRNDIPNWISKFDVFLFTSIWPEPMARSVMEAMAAGLLVIGTEVGGQAEMLSNGINSLTFKPEDAETLSNHIIRMLENWSLGINLAREGQKMILQNFTLERMVNEVEENLTNIVQSK